MWISAIAALSLMLSGSYASQQHVNLLENASFEQVNQPTADQAYTPWSKQSLSRLGTENIAGSSSSITIVTPGRMGKHAAVLRVGKDDAWVLLDQRVDTDFAKADHYVLSAWLKADKPATASVALVAQCPSLRKTYQRYTECKLSTRWEQFQTAITIAPKVGDPTDIGRLKASAGQVLRAIIQLRDQDTQVYVDNVELFRTIAGTEPIPRLVATSATANATAAMQQKVDSSSPIELPKMWLFRKDPDKIGQKQQWFLPQQTTDSWKPLSTRTFWPEFYGDGWYAVDVVIPHAGDQKVWLSFGAVDENYTLWVNGGYVGDNLDQPGEQVWDQPFAEEITDVYKPDQPNHIVVRVRNEVSGGGIWRPVFVVRGAVGKYPDVGKPKIPAKARWLEPSDTYVTPHIRWAKPSAQGALKVLFITSRAAMREIIEIGQRFDIEHEVFATELPDRFTGGVESGQYQAFPGTRAEDQKARLSQKLDGDYDCIVIGNVPWKILPATSQEVIMDKVAAGTGLVGYMKGPLDGVLKEIMSRPIENERTQILNAYPFQGLPAFSKYTSTEQFNRSTLNVALHGRGRIVLLNGYNCPNFQMLTPGITTPFTQWYMVHYDYYLAMTGQLMHWVAGRQPDIRIRPADQPSLQLDRTSSRVAFTLETDQPASVELVFTFRHGYTGQEVAGEKKTVEMTAPTHKVEFVIPPVPAGPYYADIWVNSVDKTVTFGSHFVQVTSPSNITEVMLTGQGFSAGDMIKHYSLDEPITGLVKVGSPRQGLVVEVSQRDNWGRLLAQQLYVATENVRFTLDPLAPLSVLQQIRVQLLDGDSVLDARDLSFTYHDFYMPEPGQDVSYVMWQGLQGDTYLNEYIYQVVRDAGFDMVWTQFNGDDKLRTAGAALRANLYEFASLHYPPPVRPRIWGDPIPITPGSARHIRKPCLTDPEVMKIVADTYRRAGETAAKYSTTNYHLGSETELTHPHKEQEVCFSPTCIAHFQNYLKLQYGSIGALNAEYGSDYRDWDQIEQIDFLSAIQSGQFPLWSDFRRNMDTVWANFFARAKKTIAEVSPAAKVGTEAADDPGHQPTTTPGLGGDDWWKLSQAQSLNLPYFCLPQLDVLRDFAEPGTATGTTYGGYTGVFRAERKGEWHRWLMWYCLLRYQINELHVWRGTATADGALVGTTIAPDLSWFDFMAESNRSANQIQEGIGKLILAMDRPDDGIAVLYSQGSMLATNLSRELPGRWDSLAAVSLIFPESNFQYRYITPEQLEDGVLIKENFRLLYLPYCQALSPAEVEQIRAFVSSGGTVLTDLRPAVLDAHGKRYESGALDDVFGISQNTDTMAVATATETVVLDQSIGSVNGSLPPATTDTTLQVANGESMATVADAPAIIANQFGQGHAILLNFAISDYILEKLMRASHTAMRFTDEQTAGQTAGLIQALLARVGLQPEIALTPHVAGCHVYRFANGETQLLGLLWDAPPFLPGIGTQPMEDLDHISATWARDVTLTLDTFKHVYNVLERKYLGLTSEINCTVKPSVPHVFVALPYKVDGLELTTEKSNYKQGELLSISAAISTDGPAPGLHVVRFEFTDPDGNLTSMYTQKVTTTDGKCRTDVQLSLNEKKGIWKITAHDIASGTLAELNVDVIDR